MVQPFSFCDAQRSSSQGARILGTKAGENRPAGWGVRRCLIVVALALVGCSDNAPPNADLPDAVPPPLPGVAPEACGQGFVADGKQGCAPVLPAEDCPFGQMAVPGETQCHEVAPCGDGTWGDIPVEANTQFVDRAYLGNDSDGTQAKPWTTIGQGVKAAASSAIVAIAAGLYAEDVLIQGKPVRLWGRCPAMVEVSGAGVKESSIRVIEPAASGAEIHGIAVTGALSGIQVNAATDVMIENVWVHDVGLRGLDISFASNALNALTNPTVRNSLFEQNHQWGVKSYGGDATIEFTVVRTTADPASGYGGIGIQHPGGATDWKPKLTLRGSLVERNENQGVWVMGAEVTIEATVVRGNLPLFGGGGSGIMLQTHWGNHTRADVTIRGCVVEQNHDAGVVVIGSDATIEATVVRANLPRAAGPSGYGVFVEDYLETKQRANVTLHGCLVEQNHEAGISVFNSDATIETTIVRDTEPNDAKAFGDGISVRLGNAWIKDTEITHNARAGVANFGSHIAITRGAYLCNAFNIEGEVVDATKYSFEGTSGWRCGRAKPEECAMVDAQCTVVTDGIEPPAPLSSDPPMP